DGIIIAVYLYTVNTYTISTPPARVLSLPLCLDRKPSALLGRGLNANHLAASRPPFYRQYTQPHQRPRGCSTEHSVFQYLSPHQLPHPRHQKNSHLTCLILLVMLFDRHARVTDHACTSLA